MTHEWRPLTVPGAWRRRIELAHDERGAFVELWRASWLADLPGEQAQMRQANLSRSHAGVLRGLHLHLRQADLWVVVRGFPFVALVDVRPMLGGAPGPESEVVHAQPGDVLYIPERVAHGFYATTDMELIYLVTSEYDGSDELGFLWSDPTIGIDWPTLQPVLSERDRTNPPLAELVASLRRDGHV
jgi:dTDP-4-dehydrorhamnose 3,5-epimerase